MRLIRLIVENFGSFVGRHVVELEKRGLVAVVGENGAGKSTIAVDALLWGLYGETAVRKESVSTEAGLAGDDVLNEGVGKDCLVIVDFEDDAGALHRVERWRKVGKARCEAAGFAKTSGVHLLRYEGEETVTERGDSWSTLADLDAPHVQQLIDGALGLDHALACQVLVRSQEDAWNFAQATPKERHAILTRIEGLDELDAIEAKARERGRGVLTQIARDEGLVSQARQTLDLLRAESFDAKIQDWEQRRTQRIAAIQQSLAEQTAQRATKQGHLATRPQHEAALKEVDQHLATMKPTAEPPELQQWRAHVKTLDAQHARALAEHDVLVAQLAKIQSRAGVCTECGQVVAPQHVEERRAVLESQASTLQAQVLAHRAEMDKAREVIAGIENALRTYEQQMQKRRDELVGRRATIVAALQGLDALAAELSDDRALKRLAADIHAAQLEANPFVVQRDETQQRIDALAEQLRANEDHLAKLKVEAGLVEWWVRAIPSMKSWMFDNIMGELTAQANRWLTMLMNGRCWVQIDSTSVTKSGEARDKIGLRCFEWRPDGSFVERPYKRWSGGEKRRISLAVDWALAGRLAQRARSKCAFIVLDEVDRHLDAPGREGLLVALAELRKEKETVLVISHASELKSVPNSRWIVTKDARGSRIEEERSGHAHQAVEEGARLAHPRVEVQPEGRAEPGEPRRGSRRRQRKAG